MSCASKTGKFGKDEDGNVISKWTGKNSKDGRNMRREKARWRETTHMQTPFYRNLSHASMCTRMKMCAKYAVSALCA